jgi:hypothetical protein
MEASATVAILRGSALRASHLRMTAVLVARSIFVIACFIAIDLFQSPRVNNLEWRPA